MDGSSARRPSTSILISWFRGFDGLFVIFFKLILKYTPLLWNLQVQEPYVKKKKIEIWVVYHSRVKAWSYLSN